MFLTQKMLTLVGKKKKDRRDRLPVQVDSELFAVAFAMHFGFACTVQKIMLVQSLSLTRPCIAMPYEFRIKLKINVNTALRGRSIREEMTNKKARKR